jgi:hypothetical protein
VALVDDADLVVDELELLDLGVGLADRLAQRVIQCVDRAIALPGSDDARATGPQLDRRLRERFTTRPGVGDDPPGLDVEVRRAASLDLLDQEQLDDASAASKV